ncbi:MULTISPECIES: MATE family efflux transporter [Clostridium]|uniref:MATE efflux family protein, putative n=1 Tax=Clostridium novyi (strain NT) TaxID=386415 RepID=A0Q1G8_CLONN|nr:MULTISPECIES: MATE family efflux transporter [Clostridium]ABK61273.1 MATE efflux family protein, putative [Clostridium novyi NT]KEH88195.1 hypothetical protein Z966_06345 [Clostridium novyi A str. NCTC 538]KEH91518.1 hypothetical protein Z964_08990 [Clostridium novyi A str. GD211209]KEH94179.1 hypothetical protein Z963_10885 [Clostridium botulinum C/D str. It1]
MEKRLTKDILNLAAPIFLETLLIMLLGFGDILVLGRYSDNAAIAVNTANQPINIMNIVFTLMASASSVLISQALGAKDRKRASEIAIVSIIFTLVLGIFFTLFFCFMGKEVLILIGLKKELLEYGQVYTLIVGGFLFLQGIISACTAIVRTHGRPNVSLKITFLMVVLNLFLDYVLVYGIFIFPSLGVAGAAIATTISRFIGALILFIYVFKNFETLSSFKIIKNFPKKVLKELMKIGIPSALESLSYNVVQIILTSLILRYLSKEDIAARTYVFQLATFVYVFCLSIAQSNQILIGYSVGEKNYDMANKTCMLSMKLSLIITMIMSFMAALFRYKLISIFTTDEKVILIGAGILIADIAVEFGRTFNLIFISGLRGASDVIFPVVMALISMWGISLGLAIVSIYNGWGIIGIWLSVALDECFRGICMLIRWKSKKWINKKQI